MSEVFRSVPRPQGDPNFKPVVVVLDRKIDAFVWWILHSEAPSLWSRESVRRRLTDFGFDRDMVSRTKDELFNQFVAIYDPDRERREEQQNEPDIPF